MSTPISASSGAASDHPRQWEKWVLVAYLRMMGMTQKAAGSAVGRAKRTVAEWEEDKTLYAQAREEARRRWLREISDHARQALHKALQGDNGYLVLKILERLDSNLDLPTQRVKLHYEVGEGLSSVLKAFTGGNHAAAGG